VNGFDFFPIQNFYCNFVPGEHVFGHFDFTERPYPERFPYAIVWEVYLRGRFSVVVGKSRENERERSDIFRLEKNKRGGHARAKIGIREKKKESFAHLRGASAIVLFSFTAGGVCHLLLFLLLLSLSLFPVQRVVVWRTSFFFFFFVCPFGLSDADKKKSSSPTCLGCRKLKLFLSLFSSEIFTQGDFPKIKI